ncbi:conserved hypothetical protein [Pediculus humanus corporis]|uniref:Uncharacterized protein n=1 Tax=Pediculus humanus subsp. corporis TaxID=121224 RepID=E0W176_PEDHC|nr:uncharacterized protein Phum_PHUM570140 [Pediculus humanus corporis]EEB19382.1 conserved hypothetical protein [Pediculus humanus corporis]
MEWDEGLRKGELRKEGKKDSNDEQQKEAEDEDLEISVDFYHQNEGSSIHDSDVFTDSLNGMMATTTTTRKNERKSSEIENDKNISFKSKGEEEEEEEKEEEIGNKNDAEVEKPLKNSIWKRESSGDDVIDGVGEIRREKFCGKKYDDDDVIMGNNTNPDRRRISNEDSKLKNEMNFFDSIDDSLDVDRDDSLIINSSHYCNNDNGNSMKSFENEAMIELLDSLEINFNEFD